MTGEISSIAQAPTTAACTPKTTAIPLLAIHGGWKKATEKPAVVRQPLIIADTTVAWLRYLSSAKAVIALYEDAQISGHDQGVFEKGEPYTVDPMRPRNTMPHPMARATQLRPLARVRPYINSPNTMLVSGSQTPCNRNSGRQSARLFPPDPLYIQ